MKKALVFLAVLVLAISASAQLRTGNIYGKIVDTEGNALPGVTVTLTGPQIAALTAVTNDSGIYRFPSLSPRPDYTIKAELQGFKTATQSSIIVSVGASSEINLTLEVGKLEEQVTVTATTPIVDVKKTSLSTNVGKEELQSLPTARDPWVVMQLAPAIMLDRENIGGNESGQQASFLSKGDMANGGYYGSNNIWAVDGIDITDPAALGGSALYYDFDMFEELNITTGGAADVSIQTGGIALNMVTRRGGNKMSLAGRFYLTDGFFQSTNITQELIDQGVVNTNKIQAIKDYGFNAGGPLLKDKVWWWGAYGVQDIFTYTIYSTKDQTLLNNYNFKINAQLLANNRFEALVTAGGKEKFGRNATVAKPEGDHQRGKYYWGSPVIKLQDEHVFGNNLYLSLKYSFNDAGFGWVPMLDEAMQYPIAYNQTTQKYVAYKGGMLASWGWYNASRPRNNYQLNATYFNDALLGLSHEIKLGAEYSLKNAAHKSGSKQNFTVNRNYNSLQVDTDGSGVRDIAEMAGWQRVSFGRSPRDNGYAKQLAAYIQDTITKGNFTLMLGFRYDRQEAYMGEYQRYTLDAAETAVQTVFTTAALNALVGNVPPVNVQQIKSGYIWNTFSPRLGLTWDVTGDGKTVAKLALSQYGDIMGTGWNTPSPVGTGGSMGFWWNDDGDSQVQLNEIFWNYTATATNPYGIYRLYDDDGGVSDEALAAIGDGLTGDARNAGNYSGFDWFNPVNPDYSKNTIFYLSDIDPTARNGRASTRTREALLTLEREIFPDFAAQVNFTLRRYDSFDWWMPYYPADVYPDTPDLYIDETTGPWFHEGGTIPETVDIGGEPISTGDAGGRTYWIEVEDYPGGTDYSMIKKSKAYSTYWGVDFVLTKRLSNKWFMNASVTLQDQRYYWNGSFINPTNQWVEDGKPFGAWGGGASGKTAVQMYTRWMAKLSGLYQLPFGFDLSGTFMAREGWKIPHYFWIYDDDNPGLYQWSFVRVQAATKDSLPTFYNLTLRLEKKINIGAGRLYLMADCFNVLNSAIVNRAYDSYYGDVYLYGGVQDGSWPNPTNRTLNEILNPRIFRFGVRFEF